MSAQTVAVTAFLTEVLARLEASPRRTPSESALVDLLWPQVGALVEIRRMATAEMQALARAVLAASA
jgi:hypothetical protein